MSSATNGHIKKIATDRLRPGMYVHDLNCGWLDHPFARSRFLIKDAKTIGVIAGHGIHEVYIDTHKGSDDLDATPSEVVREELQHELDEVLAASHPEPVAATTSPREERDIAATISREAAVLITGIMQDVRLGKQVEVERVTPVVDRMVSSIFRNHDAMLSLQRVRTRDQYTFEHSVSVAVLLVTFAKELGLPRETIQEIGLGAMLHDIGKIKVPDAILNKPGKLTDDEFTVMRKHVIYGAEIISESSGISPTAAAVLAQHHERYDGTGYPRGLAGEKITRYGQMAAIVDVYDAITADRCYHKGQEPTAVLRKLLEWSQHHFNPTLVHQFIRCVGIYPVGTLVRMESDRLAVVVAAGEKGPLYPTVRAVYDARQKGFIPPVDINLSNPTHTGEDRIVAFAAPEEWGIDPQLFMEQPPSL
ncbi:HD-GYP domain-containing protein [Endothiovibrio diazotrophicus]